MTFFLRSALTMKAPEKDFAWFGEKGDVVWKPNHQRCEAYLRSMGGGNSELNIRWSMLSALYQSTSVPATNSAKVVERRIKGTEGPSSIAPYNSR